MDGVMPRDYAEDLAKSHVPGIVEAALDLHRASFQYKHNTDPHIEDTLEAVAKLQMKRMCLVLQEFVRSYNIAIGVEPDDVNVPRPGEQKPEDVIPDEDTPDDAVDDAERLAGATGMVTVTPTEPLAAMTPDDAEALVGLA